MIIRTAILVDGGFYRRRALKLFGKKTPQQRADELIEYCERHYHDIKGSKHEHYLYRIFYYDCNPYEQVIYNPLLKQNEDMSKSETYSWSKEFFAELAKKRKVALRMGELLESSAGYNLTSKALNKLLRKEISVDDLQPSDFNLDITQKGVDMRIGLDISSLANKHLVDQIVLIAGDSDFVPAAKYARREGIDFILDPMWNKIKSNLSVHIDGLITKCKIDASEDSLHINHLSK